MSHHHAPEWRDRPNTVEIPHAEYMLRHGRRMQRWGSALTRWDFPDRLVLPDDRPILFAANHRSFLDIAAALAIFARFGLSSRCLVRADIFDKPVVGRWLHQLGCIPTDRSTRAQAEQAAIEALRAGQTVAMMPEGRLVPPHERPDGVSAAKLGIARIAAASDACVVPVAIHDSDRVWPRGSPPKLPLRGRPTVTIRVGTAPVPFDSGDPRTDVDRLMATIAGMLRAIDAERRGD